MKTFLIIGLWAQQKIGKAVKAAEAELPIKVKSKK